MVKKKTHIEHVPEKDAGIDPCWKWHPEHPVLTCPVTIYIGGHRWAGHAELNASEPQGAEDTVSIKRARLRTAYLAVHETVMEYLDG